MSVRAHVERTLATVLPKWRLANRRPRSKRVCWPIGGTSNVSETSQRDLSHGWTVGFAGLYVQRVGSPYASVLKRTGGRPVLLGQLQEFRFDFVAIEVEQGNAAFQSEAGFSGVAGVEIPDAGDGLVEGLVGVAEDNCVRLFSLHAVGQQDGGRVGLHDVLQQKFVASQFEDFDFF